MAFLNVRQPLDMSDATVRSGFIIWSGDLFQWHGGSGLGALFYGNFTGHSSPFSSDFTGTITSIWVHDTNQPGGPAGDLLFNVSEMSLDYEANKTAIETGNVSAIFSALLTEDDEIWGSDFDDVLVGYAGSDEIIGYGGNDLIEGGAGNDYLEGWTGADTLKGGDGSDMVLDKWYNDRDPEAAQAFRLYLATRDRFPDQTGHDGWSQALSSEVMTLNQAAASFVNSTEFQATYGATDNGQFVTQMYSNVLRRDPDPGGYDQWVGLLNSGMGRADVVVGFSESSEFKGATWKYFLPYSTAARVGDHTAEVYRLYRATLDREPDAAGLESWAEALAKGTPKPNAITGFVNSAEFQAKYGATSDAEFVTLLYNNVLDREPDASGQGAWVHALSNGMSRESVVLGFADSAEFISNTKESVKLFMRSGAVEGHKDVLDGGAGFDSLIAGVGADTFKFVAGEAGYDIVGDFEPWDYVRFEGFGYTGPSEVLDKMGQNGPEAVFMDQGQEIRFWDVNISDFASDQFIFA